MEELVNQMVAKVGIDRATAEKVLAFLKEHSGEVAQWLQSEAGHQAMAKLPGGLGGLFGKK